MSVNREDFKTSGSFINPFDLSFMLWKYKLEVRRCAVLKRGVGIGLHICSLKYFE